jgi:type IV secretion system protein VirB5
MNLFRKRQGDATQGNGESLAAKKSSVENPYLNARRTWNGHVAGVMSAVQVWQVVGICGLLIAVGAVGGIIEIGSQSKIVPLVFREDAAGNTVSVTRVDKVPDAQVADYQTAVANFITDIRTVTPDVELQRKAILGTYAYLSPQDPATIKANEYLNGSAAVNPFTRAATETVSIEIHSVIEQTKDTWQVDWVETVRGRDGSIKEKPYAMRALVTLYQNKDTQVGPNTLVNAHFLFVRDFNWSKQL